VTILEAEDVLLRIFDTEIGKDVVPAKLDVFIGGAGFAGGSWFSFCISSLQLESRS